MNTSGLLQSNWSPVNFARNPKYIHDSMNIPKSEFMAYIYNLL